MQIRDALDLATSEDLVSALSKRCDALVVAWSGEDEDNPGDALHHVHIYGNKATCLGLAVLLRGDVVRELNSRREACQFEEEE